MSTTTTPSHGSEHKQMRSHKSVDSESKQAEHEQRDREEKQQQERDAVKPKQQQQADDDAVLAKGRVSPLLQPGVKASGGHAPLPSSPALVAASAPGSPALVAQTALAAKLQGLPGASESILSPRKVVVTNSRTQKRTAKASALGEISAASLMHAPGLTITGQLTPEARAEEERIRAAIQANTNDQSIFQIMEDDAKEVVDWHAEYTNTRDVHEQSKKIGRFVSTLSQFIDKLQTVVYSHLLTIVASRVLSPHETPSSKQSRLFRKDPQALVRHLARRAHEINNALYDFAHMDLHGPGWEEKLKQILQLLRNHSSLQKTYLYPLMRTLYPNEQDRIAYGQAWTDYRLRAKTEPQPPVVTEEIGRMSQVSGVNPVQLARAFQQQAHI